MQIISSTSLLVTLITEQNLKPTQIVRKFGSEFKFQNRDPYSDAVIFSGNTFYGMNKNVSNTWLVLKIMN